MKLCLTRLPLIEARLALIRTTLVTIALLLSACGGSGGNSDSTSSTKDPDLLQAITTTLLKPIGALANSTSCEAITLSSTSATPGDIITVTNIPSNFEQPVFRSVSKVSDLEVSGAIPLFKTDTDDEYEFAAPFYILDPEVGGKLTLELSDIEADAHCTGIEFTLNALPDTIADIDSLDYINDFQNELEIWVDEAIQHIGKNPETLLNSDVESLKPELQMLWIAKKHISSDESGHLKSLLTQLEPNNTQLLANIIASTGTKERVSDAYSALSSISPATNQALPKSAISKPSIASLQAKAIALPNIQTQSIVPHIDCDTATLDFKYDINTIEELSEHMQAAKAGIPFDVSAGGQLLSVMSWYGAIMDKGIDILSVSPDLSSATKDLLGSTKTKLEKTGNVMDVISDVTFVIEKMQGALQAMQPSEVTQFSLAGAETLWIEDREETDLMTWETASISAKGEDYNLYHVLLETTQVAGGWLAGYLGGSKGKQAYGIATTILSEPLKNLYEDLSQDQCFRIQAPEYGPIEFNDNDAKWTKTSVRENPDIVTVIDEKNYKGLHIGQALLEVKPRLEQFPSKSGINLSSFLTVHVDEVQLSAEQIYHSVTKTLQVFNDIKAFASAHDDNAADDITVSVDEGTISSRNPQAKTLTLNYTAPADLSKLPAHIIYGWNGKTLPGGDDDLRQAKVIFDKRGTITLSPESACLTPGEQLPINATIEGFPSSDAIAWTGAHISEAPGGDNLKQIFTATSSLGEYTITAFSIDDPTNVFDNTKVKVAASCISMAWNPWVEYHINASGTYSDGSQGCPPYSDPDYIEHNISNDTFPNPPAEASSWADKSETYGWSNLHNSTRFDGDVDGNCYSGQFNGRNNSSVTYSGRDDGTLSFIFETDIAGDIEKLGTAENYSTETVDALFYAGIFGYYYIPVKADIDIHIEGSIACDNVTDDRILAGRSTFEGDSISIMLIPYHENGQPMVGWKPGGVSNTDMPFVVNNISCQNNEINFFDKTISIHEFNEKRPGKIVLMVDGGAMASPYPFRAEIHPDGSYESTGSVDLEVKVSAQ